MTGTTAWLLSDALVGSALTGIGSASISGNVLTIRFKDGGSTTYTFPNPKDGLSIKSIYIDANKHLICTMSDNSTIDAGELPSGGLTDISESPGNAIELKPDGIFVSGGDNKVFSGLGPTLRDFAGLPKGTDIEGLSTYDVIMKALYPYMPPTITVSVVPNITLAEKGQTLQNITITANVKANTDEIKSVSFYRGTTKLDEKTAGVSTGGSFSYAWNNANVTTDIQLSAKCSDGSNTVTATHNIKFVNRSYYGTVPSGTVLTVDVIKGLDSVLKDTKNLDKKFTAVNSHIVYAYPAVFGAITSIKDAQNFQYQEAGKESYSRENMEINGENYYVYKLIKPVSLSAVQQNFT